MKLTIGSGTPVDVKDGVVSIEHGCVILQAPRGSEEDKRFYLDTMELILAYKLRDGEYVRRMASEAYDVQL